MDEDSEEVYCRAETRSDETRRDNLLFLTGGLLKELEYNSPSLTVRDKWETITILANVVTKLEGSNNGPRGRGVF